jgi:hypothetical protein
MTEKNVASAVASYKAMADKTLLVWRSTCTLMFTLSH